MQIRTVIFCLFFLLLSSFANAIQLSGIVKDAKGNPIPFCSILIKGTKYATLTNTNGEFSIDLPFGTYDLICQHVGYQSAIKKVNLYSTKIFLEMVLIPSEITLKEIFIKQGSEDPAYEIIRHAIEKRKFHKEIIETFQCESYIKGLIKLKDFPKTFFGQNIDFEDGDTSKQKTIFLSETIADIYFTKPDDLRIDVKSTKLSGQSNGLGFSNPQIISFYDNIIKISRALNPRGFISPIADGALKYYSYKYKGVFFENGMQISKIEVIPKRKWEPLFNGFIQIVENEWTIHSLRLSLTKESQLEFADKITIEQQYIPLEKDIWTLSTQNIFPEVKFFGFDATGYFITLFSNYSINKASKKPSFGRTILRFSNDANKKNKLYWDSIRPIPLLQNEIEDYRKKDSLEKRKEDPAYLDSLDKIQNKINTLGLFLNGQTLINRNKNKTIEYDPLLKSLSFNTVEGWVGQISGTKNKKLQSGNSYSLTPVFRYGQTNKHFNAFISSNYRFKNNNQNELNLAFGKKVFQFNNSNPVPQIMNTLSTLLNGYNYLKIYEASFFRISFKKEITPGLTIESMLDYQNRNPLVNTDTLRFWKGTSSYKSLTPNYPIEVVSDPMRKHIAFSAGFLIRFRPKSQLIELSDRTININSKSPLFSLEYKKGLNGIFNSSVDFDRWKFSIIDDLNFNIGGEFQYRVSIGGFLNKRKLDFPDYNHLAGNKTKIAAPYLQSFQVAPFYQFSNNADQFYAMFLEYKFNGLMTNKIPVIKKLNLRLIAGSNMIYINKGNYYRELFLGIDNVLKILRFDYIVGFQKSESNYHGIRLGIRGFGSLFTDY